MEKPQRIKGLNNLGDIFDLTGEELKKMNSNENLGNESTQNNKENPTSSAQFNATQGISHLHQQETLPENGILTGTSPMTEKKPGDTKAKVVSIDTKIPPKNEEWGANSAETENAEIIAIINTEVDHWYEKLQKEPKDPKFAEKNKQDFLDFQMSPYGWLKETLESKKNTWNKRIQNAPNDIEKNKILRAQEFDKRTLQALNEAFARNIELPLVRTKDLETKFPAIGKVILDESSVTAINKKLGVANTSYRVNRIFQQRNDQYVELETPNGKKFNIRIEDFFNYTSKKQKNTTEERIDSAQISTVQSNSEGTVMSEKLLNEHIADLEALELLSELDKVVQEIEEIEKNKPTTTTTELDQNNISENANIDSTPLSTEPKKNIFSFIRKTIDKTKALGSIVNTTTAQLKDSVRNSSIVKIINDSKEEQQQNNIEIQKQIIKQEQDKKMAEDAEEIEQDRRNKPVSYFAFENIGNEYIRDILINHEIGVFDMRTYGTNNKIDADKPYDVFLKEIKRISNNEGIVICNTFGVAVVCTNLNSPENKTSKTPTDTWAGEKMYKKNFKVILTDPTNGEQLSIEHLTLLEAHNKYEQQTKWVVQELKKRYQKSLVNK